MINTELIEMMFKLKKFHGFKLVPYKEDLKLLKLEEQYSLLLNSKKEKKISKKKLNTFDEIKNNKLEMRSKKIDKEGSKLISESDIEELTQIIKNDILLNLDESIAKNNDVGFMSTKQLADFLQLAEQTIYGLVNQDKIPYEKKGHKLYFSKQDIIKWVKSGRIIKVTPDEKVTNFFAIKDKYNK